MEVVLLALAGALGLAMGSFLNVVVYRVPAGLSIVSPPSACPNCHHAIRRRDNVPVLSWLILRGRCRDCSKPISVRYPLVELGTGLAFVGVAATQAPAIAAATSLPAFAGSLLLLVALLYLLAISIALAIIDIETQRLPDVIVLPAYPVGVVLLVASALLRGEPSNLIVAGIGLVALLAFYAALAFGYRGGMGMGDVKLSGALGLYLGYLGLGPLLIGAFAPFVFGGLFALVLVVLKRAGRKSRIPFGPWMLAGSWLGILAGQVLFVKYLELVGLR